MRYIIPLLITLALFFSGCSGSSTSTGVGVGMGGNSLRFGMTMSTNLDFLRDVNRDMRSNNQRGLEEFRAGDYENARTTFEYTLKKHPEDPDATYFLGMTLIYQGERDAGFNYLKNYKDSGFRTQQEVRWWADYCAKRPEMAPKDVHRTMKKARAEGYNSDRVDEIDRYRGVRPR